jgi:chromosomal replication initiator protein
MAILKNKAELGGLTNIPDEVFKYIAENIVSNVRELEGALNKISIYSKLFNNVSITVDLARDTLKDLISKDNSVTVTPELILNTVAEHMEVSVDDIRSKKRSQDIAIARQLVMYLCRELTDKSLQSIGEIVGGKDHATVHNGVKRIEEKVKDDPQFSAMVQVIIKKINPSDN